MIESVFGMATGVIITALIIGLIIILVTMEARTRRAKQKMLHDERMLALEKGLPVPMDYDLTKKRTPFVRGLVFSGAGLGMIVMGFLQTQHGEDADLVGIGSNVLLVGIGLVIGDRLALARSKEQSAYPVAGSTYRSPDNPT
jgi:hypothetical protein